MLTTLSISQMLIAQVTLCAAAAIVIKTTLVRKATSSAEKDLNSINSDLNNTHSNYLESQPESFKTKQNTVQQNYWFTKKPQHQSELLGVDRMKM